MALVFIGSIGIILSMAFHSKYVCQQCGYESTGWMGKCPECGTVMCAMLSAVNAEKAIKTGEAKKGY